MSFLIVSSTRLCFFKLKVWRFHKFQFYDLYSEFYSFNVLYIFYSTNYLCIYYDLLLQQHFIHIFYFLYLLFSTNMNTFFVFDPTDSSIAIPPVSSLIFPMTKLTNCWNHHGILSNNY